MVISNLNYVSIGQTVMQKSICNTYSYYGTVITNAVWEMVVGVGRKQLANQIKMENQIEWA